MKTFLYATALCASIFCGIFETYAQRRLTGGKIVRINDGNSNQCIGYNSVISLGLFRARIYKKRNWFINQTKAGVQVDTKVTGIDSDLKAQNSNVSQVFEINVKDYDQGLVDIPMSGTILSYFPLQNNMTYFSGFDMNVSLLEAEKNTQFGLGVAAMLDFTKKFPFPTTPFLSDTKDFYQFAASLIAPNNDRDNSVQRYILPSATINLQIGSDGNCDNYQILQQSGIFAVVFNSDQDDLTVDGTVDLNNSSNYEFKWQPYPTQDILVAKKDANGKPGNFTVLKNEFIGFYIVAIPNPRITTKTPKSTVGLSNMNASNKVSLENFSDIKNTSWYKKSPEKFQTSFSSAIKDLNENNKVIGFTESEFNKPAASKYTIDSKDAVILGYLEAIRRFESLGLKNEILKLPIIPTDTFK
jgi:hypothetical protein